MEDITVIRKKIQIEGLKGRYRLLHITDTHMASFGETETAERAEYAKHRVECFSKDGVTAEQRFRSYIDYANEAEVSAVLLTGDIVDFPSPENLAALKRLSELKMPYIYTLGNHDWTYFDNYADPQTAVVGRPLLRPFCGGDENFQVMPVGELTFVALDNSAGVYPPKTAERLREVLEKSDNVIILQHIPLYCDTLHESTVQKWGQDITLGGPALALDGSADEIREILTTDPGVKAIICGHLHFSHEDRLDGVLKQYVTNLSSYGETALFEVSGDKGGEAT